MTLLTQMIYFGKNRACTDTLSGWDRMKTITIKVTKTRKMLLVGSITGFGTGLLLTLATAILVVDDVLEFPEFGIALITPAMIAILIANITKSKKVNLLIIAYATTEALLYSPALLPFSLPPISESAYMAIWTFPEFVIGLITPAVFAVLANNVTSSRKVNVLIFAYVAGLILCLVPFGESGPDNWIKPTVVFALLGLVFGFICTAPIAFWETRRKSV